MIELSPDYARGHSDGYHEALAEWEPTEAEQLRAMVAFAALQHIS